MGASINRNNASPSPGTLPQVLLAVGAGLALLVSFLLALLVGASGLSWQDLVDLIDKLWRGELLSSRNELARTVFFSLRAPRIVVAALCGAALSAAGVICQGLFRNALASPSVLGVEAGGTLAAVIVFYFGAAWVHALALPAAAFIGALAAAAFVFVAVAQRVFATTDTLLLVGFALNALLASATSLVVSLVLEDYQKAGAIMHWLLGGFAAKGWEHVLMGLVPIVIGLSLAQRLASRLDVLALGEDVATTLSINVRRLKTLAIIAVAALVGSAVSIAGTIPFVGLLVPHLTRLVVGPQHRRLLWFSVVNGMTLLIAADLAARTLRAPAELEVGILTSMLGAPFFVALLLKQARGDRL